MRRNRASARGAIETRIRKRRQSPFRFLDLPAEIRQMIYSEALCTFQPNVSFAVNARLRGIVYGKRDGWPTKPNIMVQNVNTSLLRTCRFIHEEAFDFMIKTNRYIRISSNDVDLDIPLFEAHIPVLSLSMHRVSQFPGHIMHVQIEDMGRGPRHGHRLRKRSKVKHSTERKLFFDE